VIFASSEGPEGFIGRLVTGDELQFYYATPVEKRQYSRILIYHFSREWRKQMMNMGKLLIRKTTFFLTKTVVHCLLLLGRILPQLKM
jgi:hypothetical protein